MINYLGKIDEPVTREWLSRNPGLIQMDYQHVQTYLPNNPVLPLTVVILNLDTRLEATIADGQHDLSGIKDADSADAFLKACSLLASKPFDLNFPLPLEPVHIPKPWGQEIWYTGIEERGVSHACGMPLAWLTDVFGDVLGWSRAPLLLKILDPSPIENLGDLYFEMHEQKVEVYVVTGISETAWPNGAGSIRYGFNQKRLQKSASRKDFLGDYASAVKAYQAVRNEIDVQVTALAVSDGHRPDAPLDPEQQQTFLARLPGELLSRELKLRNDMYAFTALRSLRIGDVVTVQPFVPHSLQHGVRVVEFQTPHYERYILSFGQKVLTQSGWDTEHALRHAITDNQGQPDIQTLSPFVDLITDFDEFHVLRFRLPAGSSRNVKSTRYQVVMGVAGEAQLSGFGASELLLTPETAALCPAREKDSVLSNNASRDAIVLVAREGRYQP